MRLLAILLTPLFVIEAEADHAACDADGGGPVRWPEEPRVPRRGCLRLVA